jgi:hypothetical protein
VLANGVDGLSRTKELATFGRSYGWFVPVAHTVHPWSVNTFQRNLQRLTSTIGAQGDQFQVSAPARTSRSRRDRRQSRAGGCCCSAARAAHCSWASRSLRRPRYAATSPMPDDA